MVRQLVEKRKDTSMDNARPLLRLSPEQLLVAQAEAAKQFRVSYWAGWDDARTGWCVFLNHENMLEATLLAGPFNTRDEAEAVLGPELKQLWQPRDA